MHWARGTGGSRHRLGFRVSGAMASQSGVEQGSPARRTGGSSTRGPSWTRCSSSSGRSPKPRRPASRTYASLSRSRAPTHQSLCVFNEMRKIQQSQSLCLQSSFMGYLRAQHTNWPSASTFACRHRPWHASAVFAAAASPITCIRGRLREAASPDSEAWQGV